MYQDISDLRFGKKMMTILSCLTIINFIVMDVNLVHHGYNVQRRKMYPSNPRNNLISTVDLVWQKSLQNSKQYPSHLPQQKKEIEHIDIHQNYTRAIEQKMEEEARLNKSSFRVMPVHPIQQKPQRLNGNSKLTDSLAEQLTNFREKTKGQTASFHFQNPNLRYNTQNIRNQVVDSTTQTRKPVQNSNNVSSTIFGYNINYQTFKRQSYMSKLLSDRLDPYLSKSVDKKVPKHTTFTVNSPAPVYYD